MPCVLHSRPAYKFKQAYFQHVYTSLEPG
jgi:hypothetical protein